MATVKFQLRRDTAANWASVNPTLGPGEPAIETDTLLVKYGNGVNAWNALPYAGVELPAVLDVYAAGPEPDPFSLALMEGMDAADWRAALDVADYEEGAWTPVVTAFSGSLTTYTASGSFTRVGRLVTVTVDIGITNNGTAAGALLVTLPFTNGSRSCFGAGVENGATGTMLQASVAPGSTQALLATYSRTYPGANGYAPSFTLNYVI